MGVLNVAGAETRSTPRQTEVQSTSDSTEVVDFGARATRAIEEFLSGLFFFDGRLNLDWTLLNPMFNAVSALVTIIGIGGVL